MVPDIISLLPDNIANQIAAGEVIQRPASAVKEMLENAIDAGATEIHLIIKDAGKELIQVNDNGKGMSPTDARLCFERHATSKIKTIDDLFAIRTMGFRGEAMASIAAVAQVELKTRMASDEVGTYIAVENSTVKTQEPCQAALGTSLSVKNLFYNVPARRNFLKSTTTETRHIVDEFTRVAMAFPHIAFRFTNNNTDIFNLEAGKLKQRILGLLGQNLNAKLVPVNEETDVVTVIGYIGAPDVASKTRGNQYFFVNNRYIRSAYLNHAVSAAYKELISKDEFPMFVLFIDIDPKRIDINVHPTKQEIKFEDEKITYSFVNAAIKHALSKYSIAPSLDFTLDASIESLSSVTQPFSKSKQEETKSDYLFQSFTEKGKAHFLERSGSNQNWKELYKAQQEFVLQRDAQVQHVPEHESTSNLQEEFSPSFLQIANAYIVVTSKHGFILIDQRLAHQRILLEQYSKTSQQAIPIQKLLVPQTIELVPSDAVILQDLIPELLPLGYEIEPFGNNTFIIQGTPADVKQGEEKTAMETLLEVIKHESQDLKLDRRKQVQKALAMQKAIPHGKKLSHQEMEDLFQQLFRCENPSVSPNGKSVFKKLNANDIAILLQNA